MWFEVKNGRKVWLFKKFRGGTYYEINWARFTATMPITYAQLSQFPLDKKLRITMQIER